MQREVLEAILGRTAGLSRDADRWKAVDEHEVALFVGRPGSAMAIQNVLSIVLLDAHVEIEAKERGTFHTTYDAIHMLLVSPRKERAGRGGVGF